jgi:hypothetical protein
MFFIILIVLTLIFHYSNNYKEGFFNFPDANHNTYVENSQDKFNPLTNTINLLGPALPVNKTSSNAFKNALGGLSAQGTTTAYTFKGTHEYSLPTNMPTTFVESESCEKKGPTCSAFDDTTFAANCGISFDKEGTGREGKPHIGGLYVSSQDRANQNTQADTAIRDGKDPYKVYQPTLGKSKRGTFSLSKDKCIILKEKLDCESNKSFNSPNCSQCFTSKGFGRVGPETGKISSTLFLFGNGTITVTTSNSSPSQISLPQTNLDPNTSVNVNIPDNAEGTVFNINVQPLETKPLTYICGYIEGQTARGLFKLDLINLIQSDLVTNASPKINGSLNRNGFSCRSLVPGTGKKTMNLSCLMPFTFLNMYDGDSNICGNGPVITKASSATFLESDPCYGRTNRPGNYTLECLKDRWIDLGGTPEGTGYPNNLVKANALQKGANGVDLDIDTIVDNISSRVIGGITGRDANGNPLNIEDWNSLSMSTRGVPVTTPCDGVNDGTLSKDCLSYLYFNKGINTNVGPTYTLSPQEVASMKGQNSPNTYCQPGTSIDPNTPAGLKFGQSISGIDNVKKTYDQINRLANDNTKSNSAKAEAMLQCYGVTIDSKEEEIAKEPLFYIKPYINFDANDLPLGKVTSWDNSTGSCEDTLCSGVFVGAPADVVNNGYSKEVSISPSTRFTATTGGSGVTYPTFTVALVYHVTSTSGLFIEHGWNWNSRNSFYMSNGVPYGGQPVYYTNVTRPNGTIFSAMDSFNGVGNNPGPVAIGQGANNFIIQIMSVSPTDVIHQYYLVNTGTTSTYTRSNLSWGFNVPAISRNYLNINHRAGGQQYISNIQIFNQTFTQDQVNDLQSYLLNKYFMNVSMTPVYLAPTTNWAGYEFSKDGRCGPQHGNKACTGTSCCSVFGWCAGTKGQKDDWCWTYNADGGRYDGQK